MERIADVLLEKETIFSEDIEAVLGKSAQQIAKEDIEAAEVVDTNTEVKYVIEPTSEDKTDKGE
jgi:hypothetical protein